MKILIVTQYWWPDNGAPQRRWSWLTDLLVNSGHQVSVLCPGAQSLPKSSAQGKENPGRSPEHGPSGENILRSFFIPPRTSLTSRIINQISVAIGAFEGLWKYRDFFRDNRPDLVIGTVPAIPSAVVARIASRVFRARYVIDLRDAWPELLDFHGQWNDSLGGRSWREKLFGRTLMPFLKVLTKFAIDDTLMKSDAIIVTSSRLGERIQAKLQARGVHKPVETIRNVFPAATDWKSRSTDICTNELRKLNVLYAGTTGRAQKLENAVRAVQIANSEGFDVRLKIVGGGAAFARLSEMAEQSKGKVAVLERVPLVSMAEFYKWADTALVHLAEWEPLNFAVPSKSYELMEMGLHITGAVSGETAELISKLNCGKCVQPENPEVLAELFIGLIINSDALKVGDTARLWVENERDVIVPSRLEKLLRGLR